VALPGPFSPTPARLASIMASASPANVPRFDHLSSATEFSATTRPLANANLALDPVVGGLDNLADRFRNNDRSTFLRVCDCLDEGDSRLGILQKVHQRFGSRSGNRHPCNCDGRQILRRRNVQRWSRTRLRCRDPGLGSPVSNRRARDPRSPITDMWALSRTRGPEPSQRLGRDRRRRQRTDAQ